MAKFIHAMIRVKDEEKSVAFYKNAFGLKIVDRIDFDTFTLIYLSNNENTFELELTINKDRTTPYELGNGFGHLAFCIDDFEKEHKRFEESGYSPRKIVDFVNGEIKIARFFFVQDPDGYQIEVLEKSGRFL